MSVNVHIEHIGDTEANVRANMDLLQLGILTDTNREMVYTNDDNSRLYYLAAQYYWDGASTTYVSAIHADVTATGNMYTGEYQYHYGDTDTYWRYETDEMTQVVGGVEMWNYIEDGTQDLAEFNSANADVDMIINTGFDNTLFIRGSDGVVEIGGAGAQTWDTAIYPAVLSIGDNMAWATRPDAGGFGHTAELVVNAYWDINDGRWEYGDAAAYASRYTIDGSDATEFHTWYISTISASAGNPITWIEAMQIEGNGTSGDLIINSAKSIPFYVRINQKDAAAQPCLYLEQADISEGCIDFVASDRGVILATENSIGSIRCELNGVVGTIAFMADR